MEEIRRDDGELCGHGATGDGRGEIVCIREASPTRIVLARGPYATVETPSITITTEQLVDGEWELLL